ncbi:hypothetical protein [Rhodococcus sp. SGAir0479]|uniref:hypothetical protein n=1 Tax=Rhodococcus sp. SGAir0479 TaxID=2567884 RepID=UPI00158650E2|nr:hypothetical protein [Rhodococcus sp. SGAir0479]
MTVLGVVVVAVGVSLVGSTAMAATLGLLCILAVIAVVALWQFLPPTDDEDGP